MQSIPQNDYKKLGAKTEKLKNPTGQNKNFIIIIFYLTDTTVKMTILSRWKLKYGQPMTNKHERPTYCLLHNQRSHKIALTNLQKLRPGKADQMLVIEIGLELLTYALERLADICFYLILSTSNRRLECKEEGTFTEPVSYKQNLN